MPGCGFLCHQLLLVVLESCFMMMLYAKVVGYRLSVALCTLDCVACTLTSLAVCCSCGVGLSAALILCTMDIFNPHFAPKLLNQYVYIPIAATEESPALVVRCQLICV